MNPTVLRERIERYERFLFAVTSKAMVPSGNKHQNIGIFGGLTTKEPVDKL